MQYIQIETVLNSFKRNIKNSDVSEDDLIEWCAEALNLLCGPQIMTEHTCFLEVKNHTVSLPEQVKEIIQIGKCQEENFDRYVKIKANISSSKQKEELKKEIGKFKKLFAFEIRNENPEPGRLFIPVRESTTTMADYNTRLVYQVIGAVNRIIRFSFKEGFVGISYCKIPTDEETGYPLIPNVQSCINAITYYAKWKLAETLSWDGRQGFQSEADRAEKNWTKYYKIFKDYMKLPRTLDDFEELRRISNRGIQPDEYKTFFK